MVYCEHCKGQVEVNQDEAGGYAYCTVCGHVLDDVAFSSEVTFTKGAGGDPQATGVFVSEAAGQRGVARLSNGRLFSYGRDSHDRSLAKGRCEVALLVERLGVRPREDTLLGAMRLYTLALDNHFTKGRRTAHVAAACLYINCRLESQPFMLIDFSDALQVNLFTLGAVYLQLVKTLHFVNEPTIRGTADPSLYIHRYANRLLGGGTSVHKVASTAVQIVASMKRSWLQTGRQPSGIVGAALFIAAHIYGHEVSRAEVARCVHIGAQTLDLRVAEFAGTAAGGLTAREFDRHSDQIEQAKQLALQEAEERGPGEMPAIPGCPHLGVVGTTAVHFAHGMCRPCYEQYLTVSGGAYNGEEEPPSFVRGRQREDRLLALENGEPLLALPAPGDDAEEGENGAAEQEGARGSSKGPASEGEGGESLEDEEFDAALQAQELDVYAQALEPVRRAKAGAVTRQQRLRERAAQRAANPSAQNPSTQDPAARPAAQPAPPSDSGTAAQESQPEASGRRRGKGRGKGRGRGRSKGEAGAEPEAASTDPPRGTRKRPRARVAEQQQQQELDEEGAGAAGHPPGDAGAPAGAKRPRRKRGLRSRRAGQGSLLEDGVLEDEVLAEQALQAVGAARLPLPSGGRLGPPSTRAATTAQQPRPPGGPLLSAPPAPQGDPRDEEELSDLDEDDAAELLESRQAVVELKSQWWEAENREYLERQATKQAERQAQEEQAAAKLLGAPDADGDGDGDGAAPAPVKRGRGRPLGSKTKARERDTRPPPETPAEAAARALERRSKKRSSKVDYSQLQLIFGDGGGGGGAPGTAGGGGVLEDTGVLLRGAGTPSAAGSHPSVIGTRLTSSLATQSSLLRGPGGAKPPGGPGRGGAQPRGGAKPRAAPKGAAATGKAAAA